MYLMLSIALALNLRFQNGSNLALAFGQASHVIQAKVLDVRAFIRSGKEIDPLPDNLSSRQYLEITLENVKSLYPASSPKASIRISSPGMNVALFLARVLNKEQVFFLKYDLHQPQDPFLYAAARTMLFTGIENLNTVELLVKKRRDAESKIDYAPPSSICAWGNVPFVPMEHKNDCWAACLAMMLSWRDMKDYSGKQAAGAAGASLLKTYNADKGIEAKDTLNLAKKLDLTLENPQSYTARGLIELFQENGPILVVVNGAGDRPSFVRGHARLLVAVQKKEPIEASLFTYFDPDQSRKDSPWCASTGEA